MSSTTLELNQKGRLMTESFSTLMVAATGTGKSVMLGGLIARWPRGRVLVISHLFQINLQLIETLEGICSEEVDLEQATFVADECAIHNRTRVVVASIQTLNSKRRSIYRFEKFDPMEFGLVVIDEAHHATSATYRRVVDHFSQNPDLKLVGCTATPDRTDEVGLGHVFDSVACNYDIKWAMEHGWLVPVQQKYVQIDDLDFSGMRLNKRGDYQDKDLSKVLELEGPLHEVAMPLLAEAGDRQGICFTASVAQAHGIKEVLNRHRPGYAEAVDGSLPPMHPDRQAKMERFKKGETQFLINCAALTEGFDAPHAAVCAMARPTKSRALYTQCIGRVLRPFGVNESGDRKEQIKASIKPHATILDYVGNSGRLSLICTGDLLAGEEPPEVVERAKMTIDDFDGDVVEALKAARIVEDEIAEEKRKHIKASVSYSVKEISVWSPMQLAPPRSVKGFSGMREPTTNMVAMLIKNGFTQSQVSSLNFAQAKAAISKMVDRRERGMCSPKQRALLSKFGIDGARLKFIDASKEIDKIAKNGWKR